MIGHAAMTILFPPSETLDGPHPLTADRIGDGQP